MLTACMRSVGMLAVVIMATAKVGVRVGMSMLTVLVSAMLMMGRVLVLVGMDVQPAPQSRSDQVGRERQGDRSPGDGATLDPITKHADDLSA